MPSSTPPPNLETIAIFFFLNGPTRTGIYQSVLTYLLKQLHRHIPGSRTNLLQFTILQFAILQALLAQPQGKCLLLLFYAGIRTPTLRRCRSHFVPTSFVLKPLRGSIATDSKYFDIPLPLIIISWKTLHKYVCLCILFIERFGKYFKGN
jgi:hypothetical protein